MPAKQTPTKTNKFHTGHVKSSTDIRDCLVLILRGTPSTDITGFRLIIARPNIGTVTSDGHLAWYTIRIYFTLGMNVWTLCVWRGEGEVRGIQCVESRAEDVIRVKQIHLSLLLLGV